MSIVQISVAQYMDYGYLPLAEKYIYYMLNIHIDLDHQIVDGLYKTDLPNGWRVGPSISPLHRNIYTQSGIHILTAYYCLSGDAGMVLNDDFA